jgi:hypothetical protein
MTRRILTLVCGSLLVSALAGADPKNAEEWFKEGETQYDLGNFDKAAEAFKQAFSLETNESKRPAYLYNVAQAYRQGGKCRDAAFFYKRFLALKESDTTKPLSAKTKEATEQLVQQMEDCAKSQDAGGGKPPTGTMHPEEGAGSGSNPKTGAGSPTGAGTGSNAKTGTTAGTGTTAAGNGTKTVATKDGDEEGSGDEEETDRVTKPATTEPKVVSARLVGGAAKVSAGDLNVPIQSAFGLIGGYPIPVAPQLRIEPGLALLGTPVAYQNLFTKASSTATLITLMANAGASYTVAPKISLRGDLGAGLLIFSGIDQMGSPFTQNGAPTSGALSMPAVRIGVSADYEITPNIVATAVPFAFTYAPAKDGLRSDIKSLTLIDFMVGIGYRM